MEDFQAQNKTSAKRVMIKDLSNDDIGKNVQVVGFIEEIVNNSSFQVSDKSGVLSVDLVDQELTFEKSDLINVYGSVSPTMEGELKIDAIFIQDMNKLNFDNYTKIYEMKKELI